MNVVLRRSILAFKSNLPIFRCRLTNTCKTYLQSGQITQHINDKLFVFGLGTFAVGAVTYKRLNTTVICCEPKPKKTRLIGSEDIKREYEPSFDWFKFLQLMKPEIWHLLVAVISALGAAWVNIQIPLLLGGVVNVVTKHTSETASNFIDDIKEPAIKLLGMYGLQGLFTFCYISLLSNAGERIAARLRKELFYSIITQDVEFFDRHKTGELVNRLTSDVQDFKSAFKLCISQGLRSVTQTVGCCVSLCMVSPWLTLQMFGFIAGIVSLGTILGWRLQSLSRMAQNQISKATSVADEAIGNVRTVRAFAMEPKEMELYGNEVDESCRISSRLGIGIGLFQGVSNIVLNSIVLGMLYMGGNLMSQQVLKAGDLMTFMVATQTIQRSLAQISLLYGSAVRGISSGARVFEYMSCKPKMNMTGGHKIPYHSLMGNIEFKNVNFTYPTRSDHKVLTDFSLKVPGGKMVALVGLSGGGHIMTLQLPLPSTDLYLKW